MYLTTHFVKAKMENQKAVSAKASDLSWVLVGVLQYYSTEIQPL